MQLSLIFHLVFLHFVLLHVTMPFQCNPLVLSDATEEKEEARQAASSSAQPL